MTYIEFNIQFVMVTKKSKLYFCIALAVLILGVVAFTSGGITGDATSSEVQKVTISMKDWMYSPMTIKVKAGVPVELNLDDSVRGCFRDLVIPELGIRKRLATSKDTIEFTPEVGTYTYACSMFMGQGKIIAE